MADPFLGEPDLEVCELELLVDNIKFLDSEIIDGDCGGEGQGEPVAPVEDVELSGGARHPSVPDVWVGGDLRSLGSRNCGVDDFPEPNFKIISSLNPCHPSFDQ